VAIGLLVASTGCESVAVNAERSAQPEGYSADSGGGRAEESVVERAAGDTEAVRGDDPELARVFPVAVLPQIAFRTRLEPPRHLVIPSIGLDTSVVPISIKHDRHGDPAWETAAFAAGHHKGTANPGEVGNVVISGHISSPSEGAVFRRLPEIKVGAGVIVSTAGENFMYRVTQLHETTPSAIAFLDPTSTPTLTLITCIPDGVYSHRLIVRAEAL